MLRTELDPAKLSSPFMIQTNWHVLTGAACTGKTTLLTMLAGRSYAVLPETARMCFEMEMADGRGVSEIRSDDRSLQRRIKALQLRLEQELEPSRVTFLDRAFPDCLAFYRIFDMDLNEILPDCFQHRYASVFLLERLPFLRDQALGPEDDASSDF